PDARRMVAPTGRGRRLRARLLGRARLRRRGLSAAPGFTQRALFSRWVLRLTGDADYIELRCRSAFSFLDGASLPEDLVAAAARNGYGALALADRNGLSGAPRFFAAAKQAGVRPIVGAEITLADAPPLL